MMRAMQNGPTYPAPASVRDDVRTISMIGLVHGTSHFFHLLLPPMFPWFVREYALTYTQLGFVVATFFVISGIGQALSGFLVDRVGARPVLFAALGCFAVAALTAAFANGYMGLLLASGLAGLGNSPFHPIDFSILNRRVSPERLGHAYSMHGLSGNLGWALSPLVSGGLLATTGSLRLTYLLMALWPVLVIAAAVRWRDALDDGVMSQKADAPKTAAQSSEDKPHRHAEVLSLPLRGLLTQPAIWWCFAFLFWSTCAMSAVQGFASSALRAMYGLALEQAAWVVPGYMTCGAIGMLLGGVLMSRARRAEWLIAASLCGAALLLLWVSLGGIDGVSALMWASVAGLGTGLAGPSRDMLIKQATPPGATGRVYGLVYSGLDVGFAVSAPVFGRLMDGGVASAVFAGAAMALCLAVVSSSLVARSSRRAPQPSWVSP